MRRTVAALREFANHSRSLGLEPVAVATSAVRDARNRDDFLATVTDETGLSLRFLSVDEEARYAYLAAVNTLPLTDGLIVEIGGGSVQLTRVRGGRFEGSTSAPLGAVRASERFPLSDPPRPSELARMRSGLTVELEYLGWSGPSPGGDLVGVSGTVKSLGRMHRHEAARKGEPLHGYRVPGVAVGDIVGRLAALTVAERREVPGMDPDRADVILAGLVLLDQLLERGAVDAVTVCRYGIREGLAYEVLSTARS
jgi:exopolyphosphatase/guanosine-5'-triphosphate,3'-diphosphate pyrophosphatase